MIPVLFEANETSFASNGLGRLTDAISCVVTQEVNGVYELTMRYPLDGIHASGIEQNRIIYAQPERGKHAQPFVIREVDKTLADQISVVARHVSYDLSYYVCAEFGQTKTVPYNVTPSLYDSSEELVGVLDANTGFSVALSDGVWTMTLAYPADGAYAAGLLVGAYILAQPALGRDLRMFLISAVTTAGGSKTVTASVADTPDAPRQYNEMTVSQALGYISFYTQQIQPFPFTLATSPSAPGDAWSTALHEFWSEAPVSVRELTGTDADRVLDVFGGEWEYDHFRAILHEQRGADNGVTYRYGKNITNITERTNIDELFTHVFAYWKGTASSSTNTESGEYFVARGSIIKALPEQYNAMFPRQRTMAIDASADFETQPTTEQLDDYARWYIAANKVGIPTVTIAVSVVDLSTTQEYADIAQLETVHLADTVTIHFPRFGIDVKQRVQKIVYNALREKNDEVVIGQTDVEFSDILAGMQHGMIRDKYDLQKWADKMAERANRAISGWYGGNIRRNYDETDHKQQSVYIMDTDSIYTARNVLKLDKKGISVSNNGPDGNYRPVLTISGEMQSSGMSSGIIRDIYDHYWNLDTGIMVLGQITATGIFLGGTDLGIYLSQLDQRITALGG